MIGKEVFGGSGRNFLNPGADGQGVPVFQQRDVDGGGSRVGGRGWSLGGDSTGGTGRVDVSAAVAQVGGWDWWDSFLGVTAGSMGETSALAACLVRWC
ncbi:MAG: hypothetical protein CM1200mP2_24780 [Planctomycetaceae bacterium]|nr:MAG: hypothetical protein CM1200mP2_24780 [Planctomycetaceae bacterium]